MMPHHGYYQRALLGLLWLWVLLHSAWPSRYAPSPPQLAAPVPIMSKRTRSNAPTPFAGLTHKPHWAACAHDATYPPGPPPRGPAPLPPPHRRPRARDTAIHFCPPAGCDYPGWLGVGPLRAHGPPRGGRWRQVSWRAGPGDFLEPHGTLCHGKRVPVALLVRVLACWAEG
jgi:hypothetical protein